MAIWKDIKGYEGLYQVSDEGEVCSVERIVNNNGVLMKRKSVLLKQHPNQKGYLQVVLSKNGKTKTHQTHRLVSETFIPNQNNLQQVNHIDEDKTNNKVSNLEWCTLKYNINYGTGITRRAAKLSKKVSQLTSEGEFIKNWSSTMEIERNLGYQSSHISDCCNGKLNRAYGYKWKYAS